MRAIVIIPTYNEHQNLCPLVDAVLAVDPGIDILVIDDNSPDGTGQLAEQLARETGRVRVLHRPGKQGLGTAYIAGFTYALAHHYDYIVEMDADFSHRPEDLPRLLEAARTADVVIGSRNVPGGRAENWSLLRTVISKGGSLYTRLILGLPVKDCTSGFKCFRGHTLESFDLGAVHSSGFGFQVEMNYLCYRGGFRMVEVPIVFPDRRAGQSKMSGRIFLEALAMVWRLRLRGTPALKRDRVAAGAGARFLAPQRMDAGAPGAEPRAPSKAGNGGMDLAGVGKQEPATVPARAGGRWAALFDVPSKLDGPAKPDPYPVAAEKEPADEPLRR